MIPLLFEPPAVIPALSNGAVCAALASIVWLPLSASWRDPRGRARRRSAAVAATAGTTMLAVAVRVLFGRGEDLTPQQGGWVWLAGFAAVTLATFAAAALVARLVFRTGWWVHAEGDTPADRRRWLLVPAVVSAGAAVALGWGYHLAAVAAAAMAAAA